VNDDITVAFEVLAVLGGTSLLIWIGIVLVKATKRGGGGVRGLGAALMMSGWATMRDPRNDTVAEVQDGRIRKSNPTGDPLDPDGPAS
jgi:hypothetical protein